MCVCAYICVHIQSQIHTCIHIFCVQFCSFLPQWYHFIQFDLQHAFFTQHLALLLTPAYSLTRISHIFLQDIWVHISKCFFRLDTEKWDNQTIGTYILNFVRLANYLLPNRAHTYLLSLQQCTRHQCRWLRAESVKLDSPGPESWPCHFLCDLGQVTAPLLASAS